MKRFAVRGADGMRALARALGAHVAAGDVLALEGDLGAGKTVFVKGLAVGLGIDETTVHSPTFTLVNELRDGRVPLVHSDLYRLEREADLVEIGLDDMLRSGEHVFAVEWADRFPSVGSAATLVLRITGGDAVDERWVEVTPRGQRGDALLAAWAAGL